MCLSSFWSSLFFSWSGNFWSLGNNSALVELAELFAGDDWGLDNLDLGHVDVLDLHDALALLDDFPLDVLGNKAGAEFVDWELLGLLLHASDHGVPEFPLLALLGIASLLVVDLLGETEGEESEDVAVDGLDVNLSLDEGAVLPHEGGHLIDREPHASENSEDVVVDDIDRLPGEEAVGVGLLLDEIAVRKLEDAVVEVVSWDLTTSAFVRDCETDVALAEESWNEDMAPFLLKEGILLDLLISLSTLLLGFTHLQIKGRPKPPSTVSTALS